MSRHQTTENNMVDITVLGKIAKKRMVEPRFPLAEPRGRGVRGDTLFDIDKFARNPRNCSMTCDRATNCRNCSMTWESLRQGCKPGGR